MSQPTTKRPPLAKRLYTLREAGEYLGRGEWAMRTMVWSGELPYVQRGRGGKIFIDLADMDAWIERNKVCEKQ